MRPNLISVLLPVFLVGCATIERPTPEQLGNRVRIRVEGRDVPSITSHDLFLFFTVRMPDGKRESLRVRAPATASCEGTSLMVASAIRQRCGCGQLKLIPSLHGTKPNRVADLVLPDGWALDFSPGGFFVYRIHEDDTLTAETAPEMWIGQITADESRYIELTPSTGPKLALKDRPPGFTETK